MPTKFTNSEKRVIIAMYKLRRYATTYEICAKANMSWNTGKAVLSRLVKKRIVLYIKKYGKIYWKLNY